MARVDGMMMVIVFSDGNLGLGGSCMVLGLDQHSLPMTVQQNMDILYQSNNHSSHYALLVVIQTAYRDEL